MMNITAKRPAQPAICKQLTHSREMFHIHRNLHEVALYSLFGKRGIVIFGDRAMFLPVNVEYPLPANVDSSMPIRSTSMPRLIEVLNSRHKVH